MSSTAAYVAIIIVAVWAGAYQAGYEAFLKSGSIGSPEPDSYRDIFTVTAKLLSIDPIAYEYLERSLARIDKELAAAPEKYTLVPNYEPL